jgi:hypothetical protein
MTTFGAQNLEIENAVLKTFDFLKKRFSLAIFDQSSNRQAILWV